MSTNHTPNYGLSQWEKTDKVLMEDFNADNLKIDGALAALGQTQSGHASTLSRKGNCQLYYTTYTGNGAMSRSHSFSKRPVLVLIQGIEALCTAFRGAGSGLCMMGDYHYRPNISWGANSVTFTDYNGADSPNTRYIIANQKGGVYYLVALLEADS